MSDYIFLYGTLLPELATDEVAEIINRLRPVGHARVRGSLYDLGEYPGAVINSSLKSVIHGEVFELPQDESLIKALDEYEGYDPQDINGSLFVRLKTLVEMDDGRKLDSWVYVYNQDIRSAIIIPEGDYAKWSSEQGPVHSI
jgi:gamma-glutamylcyclotransferase (GGCT)/AIG2-like uncharacterized protein YtfP